MAYFITLRKTVKQGVAEQEQARQHQVSVFAAQLRISLRTKGVSTSNDVTHKAVGDEPLHIA